MELYYARGQSVSYLGNLLRTLRPAARAIVRGGAAYPALEGYVTFYPYGPGVIVAAEFTGLPTSDEACQGRIFGFHIHEGQRCTDDVNAPFEDAGSHFNPDDCPHPYHAGDLPPLFGNNGFAWNMVYTGRFTVPQVIGRTVIVHLDPDDFTSQPAGRAGERIGCGVITGQ
jgi:Cu-Zn family superoxide dismutase